MLKQINVYLLSNFIPAMIFSNTLERNMGKMFITLLDHSKDLKQSYQKVILDLIFIKTCKKEELIPTFANIRLSVKHGSAKLKEIISRIIMESEMQVKHQEKNKLKQELKALTTQLKIALPTLVYTTLLHHINVAVKSRIKSIELERLVIPTIMDKMKCWARYVDDTLCYIKTDSIDYVLKMLNGFHRNIQFTYEVEIDSKISFLDVLVMRDSNNNINTTVYRKSTNNDIYLNWESFAPDKWKWETLKTLTKRT